MPNSSTERFLTHGNWWLPAQSFDENTHGKEDAQLLGGKDKLDMIMKFIENKWWRSR